MLCRGLPAALLTAVRPASRSAFVRAVHVESRLSELGITLPPPGGPKANYQTACFESPTLVCPAPRAATLHSGVQHVLAAHLTRVSLTHRTCGTLTAKVAIHASSPPIAAVARVRPHAHRTV